MLNSKGLYDSVQLGALALSNRVFMAPLTRNRADPNDVPGSMARTYYEQRASAGLIITEATQISPMGKGYINTPGIHSSQTGTPMVEPSVLVSDTPRRQWNPDTKRFEPIRPGTIRLLGSAFRTLLQKPSETLDD